MTGIVARDRTRSAVLPMKREDTVFRPPPPQDEQRVAPPGLPGQRDLGRPAQQERPVAIRLARPGGQALLIVRGEVAGQDAPAGADEVSPVFDDGGADVRGRAHVDERQGGAAPARERARLLERAA